MSLKLVTVRSFLSKCIFSYPAVPANPIPCVFLFLLLSFCCLFAVFLLSFYRPSSGDSYLFYEIPLKLMGYILMT